MSMLAMGQAALADIDVPGMAVEFDGWRYIPLLEDGEVHSFVVLSVDPHVDGGVTSMWFIRDHHSWAGFAWRTPNQQAALAGIKRELGLPDATDSAWPVAPERRPRSEVDAAARFPIASGVFADDPLLAAVKAQGDPTRLLAALAMAGWPAADSAIFRSARHRNRLLDRLAEGVQLELLKEGDGVDEISAAVDEAAFCQNEPPSARGAAAALTCCPKTIIGATVASGCIDLSGWVLVGTSTGFTQGACWPKNTWTGSFLKFERRRVTRISADCSTCIMTQPRTDSCTASVTELDTGTPIPGTPPNCGPIPAGYTPPAGPSIGSPCTAANPNCDGWTDWSPAVDSVCP